MTDQLPEKLFSTNISRMNIFRFQIAIKKNKIPSHGPKLSFIDNASHQPANESDTPPPTGHCFSTSSSKGEEEDWQDW